MIENSRQLMHLTNEELKQKLIDVIVQSFLRSDNFNPDETKIEFMSSETSKFLKEKHSLLLFGDLESTFRRGQQGDFNTTHSKEKLSQNNIEYWFDQVSKERIQARMAGRDKHHDEFKNRGKESIFSGVAQTNYGKATSFFCKLEAELSDKLTGDYLKFKQNKIDALKSKKEYIGKRLFDLENKIKKELELNNKTSGFRKAIDLRIVVEKAYIIMKEELSI